jgi:hypothetical protein
VDDRFDKKMIESSRLGAVSVLLVAIARDSDNQGIRATLLFPESLRQ